MKTKALLRMGLVLLWLALASGCKGRVDNPGMTTTSFASTGMATNISETSEAEATIDAATTVYVCKSAGAKKYHLKETCRGLNNCKHEIISMKQKDAESKGLGLCGWED